MCLLSDFGERLEEEHASEGMRKDIDELHFTTELKFCGAEGSITSRKEYGIFVNFCDCL